MDCEFFAEFIRGGGGKALLEELWRVVDLMTCGDGIVGDIVLPKEELLLPLRRDGAPGGLGNDDIVDECLSVLSEYRHNLACLFVAHLQ